MKGKKVLFDHFDNNIWWYCNALKMTLSFNHNEKSRSAPNVMVPTFPFQPKKTLCTSVHSNWYSFLCFSSRTEKLLLTIKTLYVWPKLPLSVVVVSWNGKKKTSATCMVSGDTPYLQAESTWPSHWASRTRNQGGFTLCPVTDFLSNFWELLKYLVYWVIHY